MKTLEVIVRFGGAVPAHVQGPALMAFEQKLRELAPGLWIEVFKETKGDDSKLRVLMTAEERSKL